MYLEYPLLSFILTGCWMAVLAGVFLAFGWCDPREYQRKLGLDIFSGVMAIVALRVGSHIKDIVYATVTPQTDGNLFNLDSILQFATGYYEQLNFAQVFNKVDNQLMALIVIGIGIMFIAVVSILSVVFGVYFVFRMCVLLDLYINNLVRFIIMGAALLITLIVGLVSHQTALMLITLLIGLVSIIKLAIGHVLLNYYGESQSPQPAHSRAGAAPAKRPATAAGRPAPSRQAPQGTRPPAGRTAPQGQARPGVPRSPSMANSRVQQPGAPANGMMHDMSHPRNPATRTRPAPKPPIHLDDEED